MPVLLFLFQSLYFVVIVYFFSCLTAPDRASGTMLNRCMDEGKLVPDLRNVSVGPLRTMFVLVSVGNLYQLKEFLSIPSLLKHFYQK